MIFLKVSHIVAIPEVGKTNVNLSLAVTHALKQGERTDCFSNLKEDTSYARFTDLDFISEREAWEEWQKIRNFGGHE